VQHAVYDILAEERAHGRTVFMSSHNMAEVERTCDRVGIIREGRLVAVEEVAELKRRHVRQMDVTFAVDVPAEALRVDGVRSAQGGGRHYLLTVAGNINRVLNCVAAFPIEAMTFQEASLEDIFLEIYGGGNGGRGQ
jgi:ABC-2 type transport system ATP-binding protein